MLDDLRPWATPRQLEYIDAILQYGSHRKAAKALKVHSSVVDQSIKKLKFKAAQHGYAPDHDMNRPVPDGFVAKGVSTLYDQDGKVRAQWVKVEQDKNRIEEIMRAIIAGMRDDIPRVNAVPVVKKHYNAKLCNCYVITDYHLSMLSHSEETGADWDLKIARQMLLDWFGQAVAQSPDAEIGVFAQLSDLLHADGLEPLTPASKHVLDVDTRFYKVVRTVIFLLRQIIDMLLRKHKHVHIIMADANHDPVSQIWLREWLAVLYENEPRITVDCSPSPYNAYEFGNVALFFHHGHKRKVTNVAEVFAAQFREMFGRTKYAYAHTGHLHSIDVKENNLMVVEQHRTLAAPDAYAARGGWLSGREAQTITYHADYGEVSRVKINSAMLM